MLAIAGGKGGVGKTTTTVALARALASNGYRPVAVDADLDMPDLHDIAATAREPGLDALADGRRDEAVERCGFEPGVRVVPAGTASAVEDALALAAGFDGFVLVDCPAGASRAVATPLRAADRTLIVSTPRRESLEDAAKTAAMARALDAPPVGAVLTCTDRRLSVESLLDCPLLGTVPDASESVLDSGHVRRAYRSLADALADVVSDGGSPSTNADDTHLRERRRTFRNP